MRQQHTLLGFIACLALGFFVVYYFSSPVSVIYFGITDQRHHHSLQLLAHYEPKTVTPQAPPDEANFIDPSIILDQQDAHFVVPIAHLAATKHAEPTVVRSHPANPGYTGIVVDVLSIGSNVRPELVSVLTIRSPTCVIILYHTQSFIFHFVSFYSQLTAQMETWASHVSVRNFWGVTEEQDYDVNCANQTSVEAQELFLRTCWPNGSKRKYKGWGWFCAQRRPGHALGWLQKIYRDEENIPSILIIVDDDTSVDIEEATRQMAHVHDGHSPYLGSPCKRKYAYVGGAGLFFNRASIKRMTRPIFCDDRQEDSMRSICERMKSDSRVSDYDLFQEGDSVFDISYKYSAIRDFCLHSDAAMATMINLYSEGGLSQFGPLCIGSPAQPCPTRGVISCHGQNILKMNAFTLARTCPQSQYAGWQTPSDCV